MILASAAFTFAVGLAAANYIIKPKIDFDLSKIQLSEAPNESRPKTRRFLCPFYGGLCPAELSTARSVAADHLDQQHEHLCLHDFGDHHFVLL